MTSAIAAVEAVPGRLRAMAAGGVRILDDSYNSNPRSVRAALLAAREVAERRGARLVVALGDMLELGEVAAAEHLAMLEAADRVGADRLILVGSETAKALALLAKPLATPNRSFAGRRGRGRGAAGARRAPATSCSSRARAACAWSASSNSLERPPVGLRGGDRSRRTVPARAGSQEGTAVRIAAQRVNPPQPPETRATTESPR